MMDFCSMAIPSHLVLRMWFALFVVALPAVAISQGTPSVVVVPVAEETFTPQQEFVGTVTPSRRSVVGSAVDGRVIDFPVDAGQRVATEEPLALLRTRTIELEIAAAKAELRLRVAELAELQEGARPEELAQGEARLNAAKALAEYAQARLERMRQMATTGGLISSEELDQSISQYHFAEQTRIEAAESLALLRAGTRSEKIAQATARQENQQELIALLEDRLAKFTIRAPFDGYVVREFTEAGAWIRQGDPIAEIIDLDPVEIELNVPEGAAVHLRRGMPVELRVDALPGRTFAGELSAVVPQADAKTRTFPVKLRAANVREEETELLRPGMLARANLPSGPQVSGLSVPKDAVVLGGPSPLVFVVTGEKAEGMSVRILAASEANLIVEGSLKVGDLVVIRGNERLRPGQNVRLQTP